MAAAVAARVKACMVNIRVNIVPRNRFRKMTLEACQIPVISI